MSARRWTKGGERRAAGESSATVIVCAAAMLLCACSSSGDDLVIPAFAPEDCRGQLVEVARFSRTTTVGFAGGVSNNLATDGETVFMTYGFAASSSGLPTSGGIVGVPVSGGPARVIAAADNTSLWTVDSFWVDGGQIHLQNGFELVSLPADPPTPSALPIFLSGRLYAAYAHDAEFGYSAQAEGFEGLTVEKIPFGGGASTVLVDEPLPNVSVGGMADAGDALLLQLRWRPEPTSTDDTFTRVWRIPKDGAAHSDVRPDIDWSDSLTFPQWLAWDGENILGPTMVQNYIVQSRVAPAGTSPPVGTKLNGTVATSRGDEVLSLQKLYVRAPQATQATTSRLLVASSKGAPAGSVLACGLDGLSYATGIAATDSEIFVSYSDGDDAMIARVAP
jgi:hypothetical protein